MKKKYDPLASVQAAGPPGTISFVYGLPDPTTFPSADLAKAFQTVLKKSPSLALQYGPEQGYGPLIDYLRERIRRVEGRVLSRPEIMLTGGASQALDQLSALIGRPGDTVLVEAPTYHEALRIFRNHGLCPAQVPIDQDGILVEEIPPLLKKLERARKRIAFLYLIPSFQNPSGVVLSSKRRPALLKLCRAHDLLVIEDDVYHDLRYEGTTAPSLFTLDRKGLVLRLGSFSKIMAPGLRLGWITAPPRVISLLVGSGLRCMGGGANPLVANALSWYCQKGLLEPHVESLISRYKKRRDLMLRSLKESMPPAVRWTEPSGGFFVWLELPRPLRADDLVIKAKPHGLMFLSGDDFFAEAPTGQFLRLAFSYVEPAKIERGIQKLGRLIRQELGQK